MRLRLLLLALLCGGSFFLSAQRVIITAIVDGDQTGGLPKAIELYVEGTVNLADYTLTRFANGGSTPGNIPLSGTYTDRFVYVIDSDDDNVTAFRDAFGTDGDLADPLTSGNVSGNGDDRFDLSLDGTVVDRTGGVPGVRENLYRDGYLYRLDNQGPSPDFDLAEWRGGNGELDGQPIDAYTGIVRLGTYSGAPAGATVVANSAGDLAEPDTDGGFTIVLSEPTAAAVTVTYELSGTATAGADYVDATGGSVVVPGGALEAAVSLNVLNDELTEPEETIEITITGISDASYTIGSGASLTLTDDDLATLLISEVQGSGSGTPFSGNIVTVEAIVTGDFPGGSGEGLRGFYLQEEASDYDGDPATSEGLFVFADDNSVSVGDLVRVTGRAGEFGGQTQISASSIATLAQDVALPAPVTLTLPRDATELESLEGMRVAPENLVVTNLSNLVRFGEVEVTSDERLIQFTECNEPDADALAAYQAAQDRDVLLIDDGRGGSNATPVLLPDGTTLSATNTLRAGQEITALIGVLGEGFNRYRIQPTCTDDVAFLGNERPTAAPNVGGEVTVVSANVLNYFTTLNSRGADTAEEFARQRAKTVAALCELDADIVGLIEIENNDNVALADLVQSLNATCDRNYAFVVSPDPGDDQIMVALIYRADRVAESGTAAALTEPASVFIGRNTNRVPLAQTFRVIDPASPNFGQQLTVCVNHFKSKGGGCPDAGDGSGNCNEVRDAAARALVDWLATQPTGVDEPDVLIVGDLNAYRMEDPIETILEAGYFNAKVALSDPASFPCGGGGASYGFRGEWGSLDYILAADVLAGRVTGAAIWAVNSAEATALDYNTEGIGGDIYAPDFYRFSDHDPLIVGLDLGPALTENLTNLTGEPSGNKVKLTFQTTPDITAEVIEVQRLDAAGNFVTIGTVRVSGGNSNGNRQYVFNDRTATAGENVYRLKLVEADGSARFSEEVTVVLAGGKRLGLQPEGDRGYRLTDVAPDSNFELFSVSGQIIRRGALAGSGGLVSTEGLPAGIYVLRVRVPSGVADVHKVWVR